MKAITLTQPWASLVAVGAKRIETRSWSTNYRGAIAIHAAKGFPAQAKTLCGERRFCWALGWRARPEHVTQDWLAHVAAQIKSLPLGCVIATAQLIDCHPTEGIEQRVTFFTEEERAFGNYEPGRFGFVLSDVTMLPAPIPATGALGLWEWKA